MHLPSTALANCVPGGGAIGTGLSFSVLRRYGYRNSEIAAATVTASVWNTVLKAVAPASWLRTAAGNPVVAVLALSVLAVLLSICSEADAFVAASLSQFSLTARLAFLVVGPMIDLKLFAMQTGTFGRRFATRFAPATFVLAIGVAVLVGEVLS